MVLVIRGITLDATVSTVALVTLWLRHYSGVNAGTFSSAHKELQ
jgi:hypothetical protein